MPTSLSLLARTALVIYGILTRNEQEGLGTFLMFLDSDLRRKHSTFTALKKANLNACLVYFKIKYHIFVDKMWLEVQLQDLLEGEG